MRRKLARIVRSEIAAGLVGSGATVLSKLHNEAADCGNQKHGHKASTFVKDKFFTQPDGKQECAQIPKHDQGLAEVIINTSAQSAFRIPTPADPYEIDREQ